MKPDKPKPPARSTLAQSVATLLTNKPPQPRHEVVTETWGGVNVAALLKMFGGKRG